MRETAERLHAFTSGWVPADFDRRYAPGKWSAGQIVTHLAHTELVFGLRVRMALTEPDYVVQPFDQDKWIEREAASDGSEAVDSFLALAAMNLAFFGSLSPADRAVPMSHPERGPITVDWIIHLSAGHQIHHVKQLEEIGRGRR